MTTGGTVYEGNGSYIAVREDGRTEQVGSMAEGVRWLLRRDPLWSRLLQRKRGNG